MSTTIYPTYPSALAAAKALAGKTGSIVAWGRLYGDADGYILWIEGTSPDLPNVRPCNVVAPDGKVLLD